MIYLPHMGTAIAMQVAAMQDQQFQHVETQQSPDPGRDRVQNAVRVAFNRPANW